MFEGRFNHESRFFADGYELSGIESVNFNYSQSSSLSTPLGTKKGMTTVSGPINQTMSISRVLTYQDPILNYTGEGSLSGSIYYNDSSYGFNSGYLTDYSLNCAVGSVPRVTANFQIATELKNNIDASLPRQEHPSIDVPTQGSLSITCDGSTTNRVIGFDYGIKCKRKAYLTIGEKNITKVELINPIEYNATIQIDVDDAFMQDANSFLSEKENKEVSLTVEGRSGVNLQTVVIPNASLVGENISSSANGSLRLTLNYVGHIGTEDPEELNTSLTYVFDSDGEILDSEPGNIPNNWKANGEDIYELSLGDNVKEIGDYAFFNQKNLSADFFVKSGINKIGKYAFGSCSGINSNIFFEKSDELILEQGCFKECSFEGDLLLPNFIKKIGAGAFKSNGNFNGFLSLPSNLDYIDFDTFYNCSGFKGGLDIPDTVKIIRERAFYNCNGFDGRLNIGTGVTNIWKQAFEGCSNFIGDLTFGDDLTSIGSGAFKNCRSLNGELKFGNSLNYIGQDAFRDCEQIKGELSFPDSLDGINGSAFRNCKSLKGVNFEGNIRYIGSDAFNGCNSLRGDLDLKLHPDYSKTNPSGNIYDRAFKDCVGLNGRLYLNNTQNIYREAFNGCKNIYGDLTIPDGCVNLGTASFADCSSLGPNLTLPSPRYSNVAWWDMQRDGGIWLDRSPRKLHLEQRGTNVVQSQVNGVNDWYLSLDGGGYLISTYQQNPELAITGAQTWAAWINVDSSAAGNFSKIIMSRYIYTAPKRSINFFFLLDQNAIKVDISADGNFFYDKRDSWDDLKTPNNSITRGQWHHVAMVFDPLNKIELYIDGVLAASKTSITLPNANLAPETPFQIGRYHDTTSSDDNIFDGKIDEVGIFRKALSAEEIADLANNKFYDDFSEGMNFIGGEAFKNCSDFEGDLQIDLCDDLTHIYRSAFYNCSFNNQLVLPKKLKEISSSAFANNNFTGGLVIPDETVKINSKAFEGCGNISGVFVNSPASIIPNNEDHQFRGVGVNVDHRYLYAGYKYYNEWYDAAFADKAPDIWFRGLRIRRGSYYTNAYKTSDYSLYKVYKANDIPADWMNGSNSVSFNLDLSTTTNFIGARAFKNSSLNGDLFIPNLVDDINDEAFQNCTQIKSLSFGDGFEGGPKIRDLGQRVFDGCYNITGDLILPDSLMYIRNSAFRGCNGFNGELKFGTGINFINDQAFKNCSNFNGPLDLSNTNIDIIYNSSFENCSSFNSLYLPDSTKVIRVNSFKNCIGLQNEIDLSNVREIRTSAFEKCTKIKGIKLSEDLRIVDYKAFSGCSQMVGSIYLNDAVSKVGQYAFKDCSKLSYIESKVPVQNLNFQSLQLQPQTQSNKILYVPAQLFADYYNAQAVAGYYDGNALRLLRDNPDVTEYYDANFDVLDSGLFTTIPDRWKDNPGGVGYSLAIGNIVTAIGSEAFQNNTNLTETVIIPGNVKDIKNHAFDGCSNVDDYLFLQGVRGAQHYAFRGNTSLTKVEFPNSMNHISYGCFENCTNLQTLILPKPESTINWNNNSVGVFKNCHKLRDVTIGNDEWTRKGVIQNWSFRYVGRDVRNGNVYIGSSIDSVNYAAFNGFSNNGCYPWIKTLDIGARYIGKWAFERQWNITGINFRSSVKDIDESAFYDMGSLKSLRIRNPNRIRAWAFQHSHNIESVDIGSSSANSHYCSLDESSMRRLGQSTPNTGYLRLRDSIDVVGRYAFYGEDDVDYRWIKTADINARQLNYRSFFRQHNLRNLTFGSKVKVIQENVFSYCNKLTGITIPDPLNIDKYAFSDSPNIAEVRLGNNNSNTRGRIEANAFNKIGANKLNQGKLYVNSSIDFLGYYSFHGAFNWLKEADLNCRQIDREAFRYQANLRTIKFRDGVKVIGRDIDEGRVFEGCTSLREIRIPSPDYIYHYSFYGCSNITGVWIGNEGGRVTQIYDNAMRRIGTNTATKGYLYIGNSVNSIRRNAFYATEDGTFAKYAWIKKADINCKYIRQKAFYDQNRLTKINFGNKVRVIGNSNTEGQTFRNTNLREIRLYDPEKIWYRSFEGNRNVTGVFIGNNTKDTQGRIENEAFDFLGQGNMNSVPSVGYLYIGSSIDWMGTRAFYGRFTSSPNKWYRWMRKADLNCRAFGWECFKDQRNLSEVNFSSGVKGVGGYSFQNCYSLTGVTIPNPKYINEHAFNGCTGITKLYIGNDTKNASGVINNRALNQIGQDSTNGYLYIGSSIDTIKDYAVEGNKNWLKSVDLNCRQLDYRCFYNQNRLNNINFSENVKIINQQAFQGCNKLGSIEIPDPEYIGYLAFDNIDDVYNVRIGNDNNRDFGTIDRQAFYYCGKLSNQGGGSVYIGKSINKVSSQYPFGSYDSNRFWIGTADIRCRKLGDSEVEADGGGYGVFYNQKYLRNLTIDSYVKRIGRNTFKNCQRLTSLVVPDPNYIGYGVVMGCNDLTSIRVGNDSEGPGGIISKYAFRSCGSSNVGSNAVGYAYVGKSIEELGDYAFQGNYNWLRTADLKCKNIRYRAFYEQKYLQSVNFSDDVKVIGERAFQECHRLTGVKILRGQRIKEYAFRGAKRLENVILGVSEGLDGNFIIDDNAFRYVGALTAEAVANLGPDQRTKNDPGYLEIGRSVKQVGTLSFYGGDGNYKWINKADINCNYIGYRAFEAQKKMQALDLGYGVKHISGRAFYDCFRLENKNIRILGADVRVDANAFQNVKMKNVFLDTYKGRVAGAFPNMKGAFYITQRRIGNWGGAGATFEGRPVKLWSEYPKKIAT